MTMEWFRTITVSPLRLSKEWHGEPTGTEPRWMRPGIERTAFDFLRTFDREAQEGLERLLVTPDPPDLVGRGRRLVREGAPERFRLWLPIRVRAIRAREMAQLGLDDAADESYRSDNG